MKARRLVWSTRRLVMCITHKDTRGDGDAKAQGAEPGHIHVNRSGLGADDSGNPLGPYFGELQEKLVEERAEAIRAAEPAAPDRAADRDVSVSDEELAKAITIGQTIRLCRTTRGFTATQLAQRAGISKGYMSELENDRAPRPSADVLRRVSEPLGLSIENLMEGNTVPAPPACRHWHLGMSSSGSTASCLYCPAEFDVMRQGADR